MTLGVEEELMLLDADTLMPAAASHLVVGEFEFGTLKTELHASVVEATTPVCASVDARRGAPRPRGARPSTGSSSPQRARTRRRGSSRCRSCRRSGTPR